MSRDLLSAPEPEQADESVRDSLQNLTSLDEQQQASSQARRRRQNGQNPKPSSHPPHPDHGHSISIVMAACNGEAFIEEQLISILTQMECQDELIISIDPSTDRTESIVRRLVELYPELSIRILQGPGRGVIDNFEAGLLQTHKDIVVLCDQDDRWHPEKLDVIRDAFDDPSLSGLVHDAAICDGDLHVLEPSYFQAHGSRAGYWNNIVRNSFIGACMALRKDVVDACLPFPRPIPMHDQFLGLQAERMGRVIFLDTVLVDYRRHGGNLSALRSTAGFAQQIAWRRQMLRALRLRPAHRNSRRLQDRQTVQKSSD